MIIGGPRVRLDWCTGDAHTIRLTGDDAWHLDLLAIPPDTPTILALTCLASAARGMFPPVGPSPSQACNPPLLVTAGISTHFPQSLRRCCIQLGANVDRPVGSNQA